MEGIGPHQMWGYSPAMDLQEEYLNALPESRRADAARDQQPLNILVSKSSDVRHVLKTLSQRKRFGARPLHFYVNDSPPEVLARHLLLLYIVMDWEIPIRQRCNLFLEVFGNAMVQLRTAGYIAQAGRALVDVVCNQSGLLGDISDFSLLKFKDRDALERVFKLWDERVPFDAATLRDQRLRHHYGSRYDFRKNLLDWDYQTVIRPNASIVHFVHYRHWRETGVAFEFGDQTYTQPNRTMATYAQGRERGVSRERRGFWLDVVVGPYMALGIDCCQPNELARQLFDVVGRGTPTAQHRHNAVEVAVYNVLAFMHELETGVQYRMRVPHDVYSGLGADDRRAQEQRASAGDGEQAAPVPPDAATEAAAAAPSTTAEAASTAGTADSAAVPSDAASPTPATSKDAHEDKLRQQLARRARYIVNTLRSVKVFYVGGSLEEVTHRKRFQGLFDVVCLGSMGVHTLGQQEVLGLLRDEALVVAETARFTVPLKKEQRHEFVRRVCGMGMRLGLKPVQEMKPDDAVWCLEQNALRFGLREGEQGATET